MAEFTTIDGCRVCGEGPLSPVMDFGDMPLADALVDDPPARAEEKRFPLTVAFCPACSLVQILETVSPEILYGRDYPYFSSFSDALVSHSRVNVEALIERHSLDQDSLVVEIASNDGYLLQWFHRAGVPVLGIDPAEGPASAAQAKGIPTICDFFGPALAERLVEEGRRADLIVGNNVLAHVPDQNQLLAAMTTLLEPSGTIVMEFPYVRDLVERLEFDTIYHEHHCYFSVTSATALFARHGLHLNRVEHLAIHGGSLRVHFGRDPSPDPSVETFLQQEREIGMATPGYYADLAEGAKRVRRDLNDLLDGLIGEGKRVAGYGAAAKGATLLNYCGIGPERLEYVVDRNIHKQGRYMPGVHIPILPTEELVGDSPDYLLLLAWNFRDEIIAQQREYERGGGRYIVPIPRPEILASQGVG